MLFPCFIGGGIMNVYTYPVAFACYNNDDLVRIKSSSGGIFSVLAKRVIDLGGAVFGAAFDDNWNVKHICVDSHKDLEKLLGSKYVQSDTGNTFSEVKDYLSADRYVLFCGTPCQIEGLNSYLNRVYSKLLLVDLVCHGVSSPGIWNKYLEEIKKNKTIKYISFRDKTEGWSHFSIRINFSDGTSYTESPYKDPFMRAYLDNIILRPACYQCRFKGVKRLSDITLADFWGIDKLVPHMFDDRGCSLVILHNEKANEFFKAVYADITYRKVLLDDVLKFNKNMTFSVAEPKRRKSFFVTDTQTHSSLTTKLTNVTKVPLLKQINHSVRRIIRNKRS